MGIGRIKKTKMARGQGSPQLPLKEIDATGEVILHGMVFQVLEQFVQVMQQVNSCPDPLTVELGLPVLQCLAAMLTKHKVSLPPLCALPPSPEHAEHNSLDINLFTLR